MPQGGLGSAPDRELDARLGRVAVCAAGELFGGVERHILGLLSSLSGEGIAPFLLLFHDDELAALARDEGVEPLILPNQNRSFLATCRLLARTLEQAQIRVVHVHGYKATVYCAVARGWYRFALVKTEHGLPETSGSPAGAAIRTRFYYVLDNMATRVGRMFVCYVSEELRAYHRGAHSGLSVRVIPNGVGQIDRSCLRCPPEFHENWFNTAIVGRVDTVKGHQLAIEAVSDPTIPTNVHLHIVGTGPEELALRALAETRGVAHRVHFLGFRRDVYNYIAHCQVLLMPSFHEGLPYTLLEAMALGSPVIATRVGGLAEVLRDSVTALLIPAGDVPALTQAILQLYRDPELSARLGEQAQGVQRAKYSLDAMAASYVSVYREALTGSVP